MNDNWGNIEAVFLKLGATNVRHKKKQNDNLSAVGMTAYFLQSSVRSPKIDMMYMLELIFLDRNAAIFPIHSLPSNSFLEVIAW